MRVLHVVVTGNFAGTERYVCEVSRACADLGDAVTVVGGDPSRMTRELRGRARWLPGASMIAAAQSVASAGQFDVCHAHLTQAETVAAALRPRHLGSLVSTRHIAAHRGSSWAGRALAPWIARQLDAEIAISHFVAAQLEQPPTAVIHNGVRESPNLWRPESRVVLVLQRLEPEKDTWTAIEGWNSSGLAERGWGLRIVGDGSERAQLQESVRRAGVPGVTFTGWRDEVRTEFAVAGLLLAPAPAEPFGLSVLEAMAAGIPVAAARGGAHVESIGSAPDTMYFVPGDPLQVAAVLRRYAGSTDQARSAHSAAAMARHRASFTLAEHVAALRGLYSSVIDQSSQPSGSRSW